MDRGKSRVTLDVFLCLALQDAINRAQRENRCNPLLFEALSDSHDTPLVAVLRHIRGKVTTLWAISCRVWLGLRLGWMLQSLCREIGK